MMDTAMAAAVLNGRLIGPSVFFNRVSTDTRTLAPGDLFVALKGERFDGHRFVGRAFELGAVAALVSDGDVDAGDKAGDKACNRIAVDDPLKALGRLAAHWRGRFDLPVVVVVGSNGKTTVKEMIASILRAHFGDDRVLATRGNLNNAIGLPLTVLGLRDCHRAAVIELGMNHPGETAELAPIAGPTVALINNAQREHQEFMHSVADVAAEHGALLPALAGRGVAVINADDPHADVWRHGVPAGCRIVDFALDHAAAVRGECSGDAASNRLHIITEGGAVDVTLAIPGRHSAANALAATAAALAAGAGLPAVVSGLETFAPVAGRLVSRRAKSGAVVIDDTYNANPDSVQAAIAVLAAMSPPRWLVLGDMGEVGHEGAALHREAGQAARAAGIERLLAAGPLAAQAAAAFGTGGEHFASVEALADHLAATARENVTMLVKGSRFMRMERVVEKLCHDAAEEAH
ncbi:MAG: UDP-N-acetylmuramoyl-tripeptide--D-alanyl-D-alanine ligase [Betaproteobacteria bacterium]